MGLTLTGFVFAFVALLILLGALDTSVLRCTRTASVSCVYTEALLGVERERLVLDGVLGARVGVSRSRKNNGATYRAELLTVAGERPLTSSYNYAQARHDELAARVTDFVAGDRASFALTQAGWGWEWVLGITLFGLTLAYFLFGRRGLLSDKAARPREVTDP
ncbi:MAG: hypothetical protein ABW352_09200 [Polyangiales bacterium]